MNKLKKMILLGSCVTAMTFGANHQAMAQGRNFDPAQMRQDMMDRLRDQMEVKADDEWKAIEPMVSKVMDAERDVRGMRMGGMFGRGGNRRNRGGNSDTNSTASTQRNSARTSFFGEPSAAITALQKAIDDKAPAAELKSKLTAVRAEMKEKEAKLEAAQEELRGVLSSRQEAIAVVNGLLK